MSLKRGEIYYLNFPQTFDPKYPNGKNKFVLVLQEGDYFSKFDTVEILLITSNENSQNSKYITNVEIPVGSTLLDKTSWVLCAQPYPIKKDLFTKKGVWCAGRLSSEKMDEIDVALYEGLCMGLQHELNIQSSDEIDEPMAANE